MVVCRWYRLRGPTWAVHYWAKYTEAVTTCLRFLIPYVQAPKPGHADSTAHKTLTGRLYPVHGSHHFCTCHIPHGNLHYLVNILSLKPVCPSPGDSPRQSRNRNSVIMVSLLSRPRSHLQFCGSKEDMGLGDHSPLLPSWSWGCVDRGFALTLGSSTIWCTVSFPQLTQEARSHQWQHLPHKSIVCGSAHPEIPPILSEVWPKTFSLKVVSLFREGRIPCEILSMWTLKRNDTNELTKQKETHRLREWTYGGGGLGEGWGEGIVREFGMGMYTLLYFKWITNEVLL